MTRKTRIALGGVMGYFLIYLLVSVLFAFICASMAKSRNRSGGLWGVLGFFFGLFTVLILAILGPNGAIITNVDVAPTNRLDELEKLSGLLEKEIITQEEFETQKARLLS
jgi:Short C-terminal domain